LRRSPVWRRSDLIGLAALRLAALRLSMKSDGKPNMVTPMFPGPDLV
jgi:hypothetical protein